jgi:hypothetical protein
MFRGGIPLDDVFARLSLKEFSSGSPIYLKADLSGV